MVGDIGDIAEEVGRKELVPKGLEARRRSLSLLRGGDGESSMISTQPEESADSLAAFSVAPLTFLWDSALRRAASGFSQLDLPTIDFANGLDPLTGVVSELEMGLLLAVLPIRSRGTRVWIFCSRLRTRARISDTICTPLFLDVVLVVEVVLMEEGLRAAGGRGVVVGLVAVLGEVYIEGSVLERGMPCADGGVDTDLVGCTRARCNRDDCACGRDACFLGVSSSEARVSVRLSVLGSSSDRDRSGGGAVSRRSSEEGIGMSGNTVEAVARWTFSFSLASWSWSLSTDISMLASRCCGLSASASTEARLKLTSQVVF